MGFKIGNVEIKNRIVLAPMAGYSNSAFRRIIKKDILNFRMVRYIP